MLMTTRTHGRIVTRLIAMVPTRLEYRHFEHLVTTLVFVEMSTGRHDILADIVHYVYKAVRHGA